MNEEATNVDDHLVWLVVATRDTIWKPFIAVSAINFLISLLDVATGELPFIPTIFSPQWARPFSLCRRVILCSWYSRESDNFYCDSAPHILIDTFLAQSDLPAVWPDLNSKVSAEELWGQFWGWTSTVTVLSLVETVGSSSLIGWIEYLYCWPCLSQWW